MNTYRPHEFAKLISKSVNTLQRWDRNGILIAKRTPTNRRYYTHEQYLEHIGRTATERLLFAIVFRVTDRNRICFRRKQLWKISALPEVSLSHNGCMIFGSGLNYERKHFLSVMRMVESGEVSAMVMAHKDRLVRFGFE